jgi:class 3 adenylate cyclase
MQVATRLAAQCALNIQEEARGWLKDRRLNLTQRIAISCGEVLISKLGGANGKWLNVFAGQPIVDAGRACDVTTPGEVLLTREVWAQLENDASGAAFKDGYSRLDRLTTIAPPDAAENPATSLGPTRLAAYIPDVLVRRAKSGHDEWLEEFRVVTVMFVKVENIDFTSPHGPEQLQAMTCAIQEVVQRYGGALPHVLMDDKGLNFLIAFGIPTAAYEDDAARALTAGLEIQRALRNIGMHPSIGVATGILYCGECGAEQRRQYSMIGPAINFASRLAGAAPDDLLSDEETAKAAGDKLSFTIAHNVRPKHAGATVLAFRPEWREKAPASGRVNAIVGRTIELQLLVSALERAREGEGARLLITGEPGIGKSRLLRELRAAAESLGMGVVGGDAQSLERKHAVFRLARGAQNIAGAARPRRRSPARDARPAVPR